MKLLEVIMPPSIYHDFFNWKTCWEVKFTLGEFTPGNMKICVRQNARKHREVNNKDKYISFDILLKFGSLDKMKITFHIQKIVW